MTMGIVEEPLNHNISYPSVISMMIPAPDNSISSSAGFGAPPSMSMINLGPNTDGLTGLEYNNSFNISDGPTSNGYQQLPTTSSFHSFHDSAMPSMSMPRESCQMIPTPGLNNFQQSSLNSDCSNGTSISNVSSGMLPQQHPQKQYGVHQNTRMLHDSGDRVRFVMQNKAAAYGLGFANGATNGGLGFIGNNIHMGNGPSGLDSYQFTSAYGSPNFYDPASSAAGNHNLNRISLLSKSRSNSGMSTHYGRLQSIQPSITPQVSDLAQGMSFQPPQPGPDCAIESQHQMQNFQHQQLQQQQIQSRAQYIQQQQQQQMQSMQHQQFTSMPSSTGQGSMASNFCGQLMPDFGINSHDLFIPHGSEHHLSELQSLPIENRSGSDKGVELVSYASGSREFQPFLPRHDYQHAESLNNFNCLANASLTKVLPLPTCQPLHSACSPDKVPFQNQLQEEIEPKKTVGDEAQIASEECISGQPASISQSLYLNGPSSNDVHSKRETEYRKQIKFLLFFFHACGCRARKGECREPNCLKLQELCSHMTGCSSINCKTRWCKVSKKLVKHYQECENEACPVCSHVKKFIEDSRVRSETKLKNSVNEFGRTPRPAEGDKMIQAGDLSPTGVQDDLQSLPKRLKLQPDLPFVTMQETSPVYMHTVNQIVPKKEISPFYMGPDLGPQSNPVEENSIHVCEKNTTSTNTSITAAHAMPGIIMEKADTSLSSYEHWLPSASKFNSSMDKGYSAASDAEALPQDVEDKKERTLVEIEGTQTKIKQEPNPLPSNPAAGSKSGKPKVQDISMIDLFDPEQVREHIQSLRQWVGQSKAKAEKNQAMEQLMTENSCQLCAVERLTFDPPPIYCTRCGGRIRRNAMYYTIGSGDARHYFCIPCYSRSESGDNIVVEGSPFPKAKLEKKKNDEEIEEWWVQCDKCESWQHQICALFNGRRNDGEQAEYTCPNCYTQELERGERKPLPRSAILGAKDLPRTILSDHVEERLFKRLRQEREERARNLGKTFDEIPGAEGLVVRVVSSVDKKLEVKQRFLELFQEENYPIEFPYKSKVVLLFQNIEGVEVCLFGMYLQEFGSECQFPNQRRVYLSYLDSVKYFRPDIKAVTGEALRTFVYHEILIGYLDYCKMRGFTSCYIWACPPLKGEDYILYCHPEIQKTPKSDKLREWYLSMLRKAAKENIVVDLTNLYDHFFTTVGECKAKVTAARLPYFDGDYWPGAAEEMINKLQQEEDGKSQQKKGKTRKLLTKRALKAAGHADMSGNASKDALLMQKLGETICPMKEDFIMVHLQHACTHCCVLMVSGKRWICKQCKNFQLCDKCYSMEQRLDDRERHPISSRDKHILYPIDIKDVALDTKDKDEILESEFFDTRQAFLSLCQGNHYQYDTLRRAKHSSMMVLYHLHNPTAPAFVTSCNICHHEIETGHGWRCETCSDYDVCNSCYQNGAVDHPHKLTNHPSTAERDAQNKEARKKRVLQLREMLDLLVHASKCNHSHCQYPNCRKVKGLFRHGMSCKIRSVGGCSMCKRMWYLLQLHARACKESVCLVPRCKDLRLHIRRMQQQSESRRRAAVNEMMRQRAAEVTGVA